MSVLVRRAARVLLVDPQGRVLLFRGLDPHQPGSGSWWFTPGGGLDDGEDDEAAARREVREETGLVVLHLGPVLGETDSDFTFMGQRIVQSNVYYGVRVETFEPEASGWSQVERDSVVEHRWWGADDLRTTTETVLPPTLADLLARVGEEDSPP